MNLSVLKNVIQSAGRGASSFLEGGGAGMGDIASLLTGGGLSEVPGRLAGKSRTAYQAGRLAIPGTLAAGAIAAPFMGHGSKEASYTAGFMDKCAAYGLDPEKIAGAYVPENDMPVVSKEERAADAASIVKMQKEQKVQPAPAIPVPVKK